MTEDPVLMLVLAVLGVGASSTLLAWCALRLSSRARPAEAIELCCLGPSCESCIVELAQLDILQLNGYLSAGTRQHRAGAHVPLDFSPYDRCAVHEQTSQKEN
jgi:hypothetical protein